MTPSSPKAGTTAYSYVRFSTPSQAEGDSLRRQTEAAERYAVQHGLTLDTSLTFRDLGVSAFRGQHAKDGALAAFIQAVEKRRVKPGSYLLVENLDRLSRERPMVALKQFEQILELGVSVVTLQDGKRYTRASLDGDDIADLMTSLLHMHRAHQESRVKSVRVSGAWENKRRRAASAERTPLTGACPYWMRLDRQSGRYVVIDEKKKVVQRIFKMASEGMGKASIAKQLNEEGIRSIGKVAGWQASYVQKLLTNEAVIGTYQPHRTVVGADATKRRIPEGDPIPDYFPAVVPKGLFVKVRDMRRERQAPSGPRAETLGNLFTGLLRCGHCGGGVAFVNKGKSPKSGGTYLACERARRKLPGPNGGKRCEHRSWRYPTFEAHVLTALWNRIDWSGMAPRAKEATQRTVDQLEERKGELQVEWESNNKRLEKLADALGTVGKSDTLLRTLQTLERRQMEIEAEARTLGQKLEAEQDKLRMARESAKEVQQVFAEWMKTASAKDSGEPSTTRNALRFKLASVLRQTLQEVRLYGNRLNADSVVEVSLRGTKELVRLPIGVFEKLAPSVVKHMARKLMISTGGSTATAKETARPARKAKRG